MTAGKKFPLGPTRAAHNLRWLKRRGDKESMEMDKRVRVRILGFTVLIVESVMLTSLEEIYRSRIKQKIFD